MMMVMMLLWIVDCGLWRIVFEVIYLLIHVFSR
jgi:hypothetical protein